MLRTLNSTWTQLELLLNILWVAFALAFAAFALAFRLSRTRLEHCEFHEGIRRSEAGHVHSVKKSTCLKPLNWACSSSSPILFLACSRLLYIAAWNLVCSMTGTSMNTSTPQGPKCVASPATPCFAMGREATVHSSLSPISVATWVQDVTTHLNNPGW